MTDKEKSLIAALRQVENLIVAYQNPTYQDRHYFMRLETLTKARDVAREAIAKAEAKSKTTFCVWEDCTCDAEPGDNVCRGHRHQMQAEEDRQVLMAERRHAKEQMDNWPRPEAAND